jgi:hypothetical protein
MLPIAFAIALAVGSLDPTEVDMARVLHMELARFPPLEVAKAWTKFGDSHYDWVQSQSSEDWRIESIRFYDRWRHLSNAQDPKRSLSDRMQWLDGLKRGLGPKAYFQGHMPDLPLRRFKDGPPPIRFKQEPIQDPPPPNS